MVSKTNNFFKIIPVFSALVIAAAGVALADEIPSGITIDDISYSGNGCPDGSVGANISEDGQAMTVLFDDFLVETTDRPRGVDRKQCNLNLKLNAPPGWSYSLFCVDYRGYADLEEGVTGNQEAVYKMKGQRPKSLGAVNLEGPYSDDYSSINAIPVETLSWSGCKANEKEVTITTTIDVKRKPPTRTQTLECGGQAGGGRWGRAGRGGPRGMCKANGRIKSVKVIESKQGSCQVNKNVFARGDYLVVRGCAGVFEVELANGRLGHWGRQPNFSDDFLANLPGGLMTVDSVDGELKHHYGLKWKRCAKEPGQGGGKKGKWVQNPGYQRCERVCKSQGLQLGADANGAMCASGESRPESAMGKIDFKMGCWGACSSQGDIATKPQGLHCYQPGQKKDFDRTDLTVGCFCKK